MPPKNNEEYYKIESVLKEDYIISYDELKKMSADSYVLIDVRDYYDYNNGHIEKAQNISSHNLFDEEVHTFMRGIKNSDKNIVLYGKNPDNALTFWMLLYQLGYENVKLLAVETSLVENKFMVTNKAVEKPFIDYAEAIKKATANTPKKAEQTKPKKVITVKKKKKRVPEGGC